MRAVMVGEHGGPEVLQVTDVPAPEPGPGQLLVEVAAAGVNFADIYAREGRPRTPASCRSCSARRGPARSPAAGPGTEFAVGDRVAWTGVPGCYAEQVVVARPRPRYRCRTASSWTPPRPCCCRA